MDPVRIGSSPPIRNKVKTSDREIGNTRQLYNGPPNFEVVGRRNGKRDDGMLMLIKRSAFVPPGSMLPGGNGGQLPGANWTSFRQEPTTHRTSESRYSRREITTTYHPATPYPHRGQLPGPNWTSFRQEATAHRTSEPRYPYRREIATTYHPVSHKPHPYDDITMLSDRPKHRPLTISRVLDAPSDLLRSQEPELRVQDFKVPGSRSLHTSHSKTTQILFQSSLSHLEQSQQAMATVTASQLAKRFSTTSISQKDDDTDGQGALALQSERYQVPGPSSKTIVMNETRAARGRLRELRQWEYTTLGRLVGSEADNSGGIAGGGTRFSLLSYNILAQQHLENHRYLYKGCNPASLNWGERFHLILKEISDFSPDIICFQEMEEAEFHQSFTPALEHSGYRGVFKKRSGDKPDGCAIFWSGAMFSLVGKLGLNLHQGHVPLLDRDNMALMLKLETKSARNRQRIVVATTHLLFNPKRTDVKLAQVQLLLAELDRFSFSGFGRLGESVYLPILLTGDFNAEPHSSISNFITEGSLQLLDENGVLPKRLRKKGIVEFLPTYLGISDQCQHYQLHLERAKQWKSLSRGPLDLDRKTQLALINIQSDKSDAPPDSAPSTASIEGQISVPKPTMPKLVTMSVDVDTHERLLNELGKLGVPCTFGSGILSHDLKLRNIYEPKLDRKETRENVATTKQGAWKCVDFIFQGMQWNPTDGLVEGNLKLIRRLRLLSRTDCKELGPIPNLASPSDHYPLLAEFLLK